MVKEQNHVLQFMVSDTNFWEFDRFCDVLRELGVDISRFDTGRKHHRVTVYSMPTLQEAKRMRTRNAGRPGRGIQPPEGSPFTVDTTLTEFMEWREEHDAKECMEALGLPQATYYRKLKYIKMHVDRGDYTLGDVE